MTPGEGLRAEQLTAALAPDVPWAECYARIEADARTLLTRYHWQRPAGVTTVELVEALFPEAWVEGPAGIAARKRVFKALAALATRGLSDCATKGEPVKRKFGMIRPWVWNKPDPARPVVNVCPKCKRPL